MSEKLTSFQDQAVAFAETQTVKDGVLCDVYRFEQDESRDVAIVSVATGVKTPLQQVLGGVNTVEGYLSGTGRLTIKTQDGERVVYDFPNTDIDEVEVQVGEIMQWESLQDLVFCEVCTPPYEDGRFLDVDESKV